MNKKEFDEGYQAAIEAIKNNIKNGKSGDSDLDSSNQSNNSDSREGDNS